MYNQINLKQQLLSMVKNKLYLVKKDFKKEIKIFMNSLKINFKKDNSTIEKI